MSIRRTFRYGSAVTLSIASLAASAVLAAPSTATPCANSAPAFSTIDPVADGDHILLPNGLTVSQREYCAADRYYVSTASPGKDDAIRYLNTDGPLFAKNSHGEPDRSKAYFHLSTTEVAPQFQYLSGIRQVINSTGKLLINAAHRDKIPSKEVQRAINGYVDELNNYYHDTSGKLSSRVSADDRSYGLESALSDFNSVAAKWDSNMLFTDPARKPIENLYSGLLRLWKFSKLTDSARMTAHRTELVVPVDRTGYQWSQSSLTTS